jgi:diacylglycerol kinase family enzyme
MNPQDGYIRFIANPKSGASSRKLLCQKFHQYLQLQGFDIQYTSTRSLQDAHDLSRDAADDPACALVVTAGGDGTVREAANGLQGSDTPLLIVPSGTENLLASECGLDERLKTLTRTFEQGYTRPLDLGRIDGHSFTCITGFGFDGEVVEHVHQQREGHIDYLDYVNPLWQTFWNYRFHSMCVEVDGETVFDGPGLIFVGNISRYAMGLQILHYADFSDGLLDICIYKCAGRLHLFKHSILTVLKRHADCKDVIYRQGKQVRVSSPDTHIKSEIDGDPGPRLPIDFSILPHAIHLMVPQHAKPAGIRTRIIRAIG